MFCEKCGTKNRKNANYCKECGTKISKDEVLTKDEVIKLSPSYKEIKPEKPKKEKKKLVIILMIILLTILISIMLIFAYSLKPKSVATNYFLALMDGNNEEIYKYLGIENKDFTSKRIFANVYEDEEYDLLNYKVVSENISNDGLEATVVIHYTLENSSGTEEKKIELIKDKKNILFLFDNWIISGKSSVIVTDNKLKAPKGAKVELEKFILDKEYLEKESKKEYDSYFIPQMIKGEYSAKVTLNNGIILKDDINVGNSGNINLLSLDVSEPIENKIEKELPDIVDFLYSSAISNKKFDEISKEYEYKNSDLENLKKYYNDFQKSLSDSLTKFKVTEVDIISCEVTSEGYLNVTAEIEYDYTVKYSLLGKEEVLNRLTKEILY